MSVKGHTPHLPTPTPSLNGNVIFMQEKLFHIQYVFECYFPCFIFQAGFLLGGGQAIILSIIMIVTEHSVSGTFFAFLVLFGTVCNILGKFINDFWVFECFSNFRPKLIQTPWKSMKIHENPWKSMEIQENPWNSPTMPKVHQNPVKIPKIRTKWPPAGPEMSGNGVGIYIYTKSISWNTQSSQWNHGKPQKSLKSQNH